MRIAVVVGARPQFVKAAALSRAIQAHNSTRPATAIEELLIHTGQHYDCNMSDIFFRELRLPQPHRHLGIGGLSQGAMTGRALEALEAAFQTDRPDWVVVFGDTNSTLAGALAASKMHIKLAHVEAGLRSFNRSMPEEINRIIADQCSDLLFTPTAAATRQLAQEGFASDRICQVGDVMYDSALHYLRQCDAGSILNRFDLSERSYILATIHRSYNTDDPHRLQQVMEALSILSKDNAVILPIHPRTKAILEALGIPIKADGLKMVEPLGYLDMLALESQAKLIITDSGGVQKEAYFCKVPCVTVRTETEWTELVEAGVNRLSDVTVEALQSACDDMLSRKMNWQGELYGSGEASHLIVKKLCADL